MVSCDFALRDYDLVVAIRVIVRRVAFRYGLSDRLQHNDSAAAGY
jgi:hypothetical protein